MNYLKESVKKLFPIKRKHCKRITCFTVSILIMLSLFGCTENQNQGMNGNDTEQLAEADSKLRIVAANFPCYDFARAITGDKAEITMLIPPGNEVHSYEPTPQDMITIGNCDLFLYTGGESDVYIEEILGSFSDKSFQVMKMTDFVTLYEEETIEGMQVRGHSHDHSSNVPAYIEEEEAHSHEHAEEEAHSHENEEYDEHVWTSPKNAIRIIEGMMEVICGLDEENAELYEKNAKSYMEQIEKLDKQFEELFDSHKDEALFVGDRFPFLYFAKEYGITYYAVFPSCNGESEPSARTMAFFIEKAKEYEANTIFYLELSNSQTANAAAEAIGADTHELHSCHNVTREDFRKGVTYVELMERNYHALREAF